MWNGSRALLAALTIGALAACGGGDADMEGEGEEQTDGSIAAGGAAMMPDWMTVDSAARTVTLEVTAGSTNANNYWNFNGYTNGNATITVPSGYAVTIRFRNSDPAMAHSLVILPDVGGYAPSFEPSVQPAFANAATPNPTDMAGATAPGGEATVRFTADRAGDFGMVCLVPGHATVGMWIRFSVTDGGRPGVTTTG